MTRHLPLTFLFLVLCQTAAAGQEGAHITEGDFLGWPALILTDSRVEAVVVPSIGRLVSFRPVEGRNRLWLNPDLFPRPATPLPATDAKGKPTWRNYGGFKVWPFPWTGWPPDPALDGGACTVRLDDDNEGLTLTTARSEVLDLQSSVHYRLDGQGGLVMTIAFTGGPVPRSIWPVVQVPGTGIAVLPLDPGLPLSAQAVIAQKDADLATFLVPYGDQGVYVARHAGAHRKVDAQTTAGWVAGVWPDGDGFAALRLRWDHPREDFPQGRDASIYFNDDAQAGRAYLELECYSPVLAGQHSWTITLDCPPLDGLPRP